MKNKGFTLIELLAVIVILTIIALIIVPAVENIIDNSRNSVLLVNAESYKEAIEKTILNENVGKSFNLSACKIENSKLYCDNKLINIKLDGQKPIEGELKLENNKIKEMVLRYSDEIAEEVVIYKNNKYKIATYETYEGDNTIDLADANESVIYNYKIHNNVSPKLPAEYQEIEYIESTGTQYIDTGYVNSEDYKPYKIEVDFQFTDLSVGGVVFGTARTTENTYPLLFSYNLQDNAWVFSHYGYSGNGVRFGTPDTNRHNVKYVFGQGLYLDDVLQNVTATQASKSSNSQRNIGLFARIRGTEPNAYAKLRMYSCKFYESDDVLVRHFVPCYRKSDNVIGLYDLSNDVFYDNAGTGSFVPGQKIEYLYGESNEVTGKYEIKISLMIGDSEYDSYTIEFDSPLKEGEYIDYRKGSIVRLDGTEEKIDLPELKITEPNTTLKIEGKGKLEVEVYNKK